MPRLTSLIPFYRLLGLALAISVGLAGCRSIDSIPLTPPFAPSPTTPQDFIAYGRMPTLPSTPVPDETGTQAVPVQPTLESSPTPLPALPKEHYLTNIRGHRQYFSLGCEAAAAKDWANYFQKDFNEFEFQYKLPLSDNPDFGFVGDVNSPWGQVPPYSYGVDAGPIADLLNRYGIPAKATKGFTLEQLITEIAQDKPVIAWVIGNVVGGVSSTYTDKKGNQTVVAAYEHVIIVTGYNQVSTQSRNVPCLPK